MKKLKKTNKDIASTVIVSLIVFIFLLLVTVGIESRKIKKLDHYITCADVCYPNKVDVEKSRIYCKCIENEQDVTSEQ